MGSSAPLGTKNLFNTPGAHLPGYVREIARELMKKGKTKSEAVQMAIGIVKRWAAEGKPKAVAAAAEWEKAKAKAHATPNKGKADLSNPSEDAEKDGHCMIALEVPDGTVAGKDGLHLTLAYLGADVGDRDFAGAVSRALTAAQEVGPITGSVGGLGVFPPKDGQVPVWATVDAPGVARLHDYVRIPRRRDGVEEHGFTPHITLDWIKEGGKLPAPLPKTPVTFTHLIVKRGSQQFRFQLGGDYREWSNPLALSGRQVLLAQDPSGPPPKKAEKKHPKKGEGEKKTGQRYKHGWIPVDENGKQTGPAEPPAWLKAAQDKHKAAGGRTAEEIQGEKAKGEFKARAEKAAAPAKKAAAEAKQKGEAAERKAKQDKTAAERTARQKAAAKERAGKAAEREAEKKKADRDRLVSSAYRQAMADRKAGRELSEQQKRVVAHVEARQKKDADRLRRVDVGGPKVPSSPGTAQKSTLPAKKKALAKPAGVVTANTVNKSATVVRARSYTSGQQNRNRSRRQGGTVRLANDDGVNVIDFAGRSNPLGQLAFRYKHGWILINPAIPSRGRGGGGLARKHGHKSGGVTHGHFAAHPSGKGKVFVPERSGGENNPAKLKAAHTKRLAGAPAEKSKYGLTAAQKDSGGSALKPSVPTPAEVKAKKDAATKAAIVAKQSNSVADAQVAAKKYADAFVSQKKAGDLTAAEHSKTSAQAWAKKAQQLKAAEKASADAKKKFDAEQAELKAKAEAEQKAKKVAAQKKSAELIQDAYGLGQMADKMPDGSVPAKNAKAAQHQHAADKYADAIKVMEDNGLDVGLPLKTQKAMHEQKKAALNKEANEQKALIVAAQKASTDAYNLSDDAEESKSPADYKAAAVAHWKAAEKYSEIPGMSGDAAMHDNKADEMNNAYAKAKKAEADLAKMTLTEDDAQGMSEDAYDLSDVAHNTGDPDDFKKAMAAHKKAADAYSKLPNGSVGKTMHEKKAAQLQDEHDKQKAQKAQTAAPAGPQGVNDAVKDVIADFDETMNGKVDDWDSYLKAVHGAKTEPSNPAHLQAMVSGMKKLKADGVTPTELQQASVKVFKKTGIISGAKKKAASKKVITSQGIKEKKVITPDVVTTPTATPAPAPPVSAPEISLPGPGMYADGNAIAKAKMAADKLPEGPQKDAQLTAVSNAMKAFKAKHNKEFDLSSVELMPGAVPPKSYSKDLAEHPSYADAVAAGFTPVNPEVSANGGWKPSDVPGLKSTKGAYHYSGNAYTEINAQLRKYKSATGGNNDAAIAQMDKEFAAVPPLTAGIVTTRRMSSNGPFPDFPPAMEPGAVFKDHGYSSTSKDPGVWSGKVVMQVRVPAGAKVLDLNHTTGSQHSGEKEILLNRGSQYRIVSDGMTAGERRIVVELVV